MTSWLKQSTAVDISFGPFVDSTDGFTPETALSLTQAECRLKKNAAAWAQKNDATTAPHEEEGWYEMNLNTTDTNTLGILTVAVYVTGALPVWKEYMVVAANVYDSIVGGGDTLDVQVTGIGAGAITAASIATGAIDADALATDAVTEIWAIAMSDLAAVPTATASVLSAINWIFELHRNKRTQTSTTETVFKDDAATSLSTSTKSDDGTTFTRGEYA